jgi:hypothetical protein
MFVKTVAEYKKMSLRHTGEIEEITERQNEEAREVCDVCVRVTSCSNPKFVPLSTSLGSSNQPANTCSPRSLDAI